MKRLSALVLSVAALSLSGCSAGPQSPSDTAETVTLQVFAAASLQHPFEKISEEFTSAHPGIEVDVSAAGSSTLVHNLSAGAPADVLATADETSLHEAENAGLIDSTSQTVFAANTLVGIVPADNPAQIDSLDDAAAPEVSLVTCAPQVPCGALSQTVAEAAGVELAPVSEEHQVVDVVGKVRTGQADAGLVYATDALRAQDNVATFAVEGAEDFQNLYPIARTVETEHPDAADEFINYVLSERGQLILDAHGFLAP